MSNGLLVPDELVVEIMSGHIRQLDNKKGFLLDSFPGNLFQAEAFDSTLSEIGVQIDRVVFIDLP